MSEMRPTKYLIKKILELLSEFKKELILTTSLFIISTLALVYAPKLLGKIISSILYYYFNKTPFSVEENIYTIIYIAILYIVGYALNVPISRIMAKVNEKITANLKIALYDKLNYLSPIVFSEEYSGNILSKLNKDVANIKSFINKTLVLFLSDILMIVFVFLSSLTLNINLSIVFLIVVPFYILLMYISYKKSINHYKTNQDHLSEQMGIIGDYLPNRLLLKIYDTKNYSKKQFNIVNDKQNNSFLKSRFYFGLSEPVTSLLAYIVQVFTYVYGGYLLSKGIIDIGTFTTFTLYVQMFKRPFLSLSETFNPIKTGLSSFNNLLDILEYPVEINENLPALDKKQVKGELEFKNITYDHIKNLNFKINPGEIVSINGEHRNNLINLLLTFKNISHGEILLDGENIHKYNLKSYINIFGICFDDDWILNNSVFANIAYGGHDVSLDEVVEISKSIGLDTLIEKFPEKYDTVISEDFQNFSRGEANLICIARALISDPKILILNYPNALSNQKLKEITKGRTTIFLSSDNNQLEFADKTINLD
ncbi:ABC transporter ATP-binding protein [Methanobrevibacter sp.]